MVRFARLFNWDGRDRRNNNWHDELSSCRFLQTLLSAVLRSLILVLPTNRDPAAPTPVPAKEVTKVALRLKFQIEQVIPCELEENLITKSHSPIITPAVIEAAKSAGGDEYKACVVYCLLTVKKWFRKQALLELWDSDLHDIRAVACEIIAKRM